MSKFGRIGLRLVLGALCLLVTLHGVLSLYGLDLRRDRLVSVLYLLFQMMSFPVFLWVKGPIARVFLFAVSAAGYLLTYSLLNWRNCAELNYCVSPAATVFETLGTRPVLATLAVLVLSAIAACLGAGPGREKAVA